MQKNKAIEDPSIIKIKWHTPKSFPNKGKMINMLSFDGASYLEEKNFLPYLLLRESSKRGINLKPIIQVVLTETLTAQEEVCINLKYITEKFEVFETTISTYRKVPFILCKFVPIRINKTTGKLEKLVSCRIQWQQTSEPLNTTERNGNLHNNLQSTATASVSVLATGTWYKIGTTENAIYKMDKSFLQHMGINVTSIDPRNIKIYGNGGEILSEANSDFHYDDLTENAIFVQGEADGVFNNNDYILFYGQSPHKWKYNPGKNVSTRFSRNKHYYSDSVFYFLNVDNPSVGKRITIQANSSAPANYTVTSFDDFAVHEVDATNLVQSGRELYGESFENAPSYSFGFSFLNLQNDTVWLKTDLLGTRIGSNGVFNVNYPSGSYQIPFNSTGNTFEDDLGKIGTGATNFIYNGSTGGTINVTVNTAYNDESGWLNYLWLNVRRGLAMQGSQMTFRNYRSISPGRISQFNLQSSSSTIRIWNVTNQFTIIEQDTTVTSNGYSFTVATDTLQQFIAFDGTSYNTPAFVCTVQNQNLHQYQNIDYVIVAPSIFNDAAIKLKNLHAQYEHLTCAIVTPDQIYNEFSSGAQDITAIRQFMRMLYNKPGTTPPQYLLLYGTGSYLQKNRYDPSNTVFVPAFETYNSYSPERSLTGDDFYALLDDNEGVIDPNGSLGGQLIDIGVGRIPVKNYNEAEGVANKTVQYYTRSEPTASCCDQATQNTPDWRNWVSLIADDPQPGSGNSWEIDFIEQQEHNAGLIGGNKQYNIDKIYLDAYQIVTVPGGLRHPDAVTALNNRIAKGALIIGYSGHGGTLNLSNTEIVSVNQIQQWNNINNLPLWFTATCQFSTYDNPAIESAGEDILLNANGGGIGLFTTCRTALVSDGDALGQPFYAAAIDSLVNGKHPTMGDIIRITKQSPGAMDKLNFCLLGDPAVTLSYPKQYTTPLTINNHTYTLSINDTLSALGKYTITGFVSDINGNRLTNFNGSIYITVFDKPTALTTLNNAGNVSTSTSTVNYNYPYLLQESVLFKGKSIVTNGNFTYTFIVPKDIMYNFGYGKISYYAQQNDTSDAAGYYEQIIVGGTSNNPIVDHQGPIINLFMNDSKFVSGGTTNQDPFIYASLFDSSGVNTTGNSIGHDLIATLDANTAHEIVLNDYYQADLNKYQSGKLLYRLSSLPNGNHTLSLKAWDVMDNSSNSTIDFVVAQNAAMALSHVLNYPNPFTTSTNFFIEHNQACDYLNVEVEIFTITGKIVKTISQTVENQGFRTDGIHWDGRDNYGDKLARGVYIYKVIVKNTEGSKAEKIEKLVILN
ncbi:MAG: type IX secretion system sortase PorU [Bacteroidia bacterium]